MENLLRRERTIEYRLEPQRLERESSREIILKTKKKKKKKLRFYLMGRADNLSHGFCIRSLSEMDIAQRINRKSSQDFAYWNLEVIENINFYCENCKKCHCKFENKQAVSNFISLFCVFSKIM